MNQYELILNNPATEWENRTPIGNGFMGAMIEGSISLESLQLNEERVWSGKRIEIDSPDFRSKIDMARSLLIEGKAVEADRFCVREFAGDFHRINSYETAGELLLKLHENDICEDYRRILDLKRGIAIVSYKKDGTAYSREYFASYPEKLIAVRITSDGEPISLDASLFRKNLRTKSGYGILKAEGRPMIDGKPFSIAVKFKPDGGKMYADGSLIRIRDAKTCDIFISIVTDGEASVPENIDYDTLKTAHTADFTALTKRCEITLPDSGVDESLAVNERLNLMKQNGTADNGLTELYFNFGRYLLISSSRPGSLPANLQGVWNGYYKAPWNADYHTNINLQMNYWPAEVTNLGECALPLFDYINENMLESGKETAEKLYKCRGAVLHHVSDIYGYTAPADGVWGLWPLGGAWLCYHLWEHYLYTLDTEFLRDTAYPYISECTRFFLDYMFEHNGVLLSGPSTSPENRYYADGKNAAFIALSPSMDIEVIGGLLDFYIKAEEILGIDKKQAEEALTALSKMPPLKVGRHGQLMEWLEDYDEPEPGHRHISHMFGIYPGASITDSTPELFKAAKATLERRLSHGGGHTGWSAAWLIALFARLREGNRAHDTVMKLLTKSTKDNLLDSHPPFQIDGNFGATAAIAEMLLQSHEDVIRILPALPDEWHTGSFKGLMARGGIEVSAEWKNMTVTSVKLKTKYDAEVKLLYNGKTREVTLKSGSETEIK